MKFVSTEKYNQLEAENKKNKEILAALSGIFGEKAKEKDFDLVAAVKAKGSSTQIKELKSLFGDEAKAEGFNLVEAVKSLSSSGNDSDEVKRLKAKCNRMHARIQSMKGSPAKPGAKVKTQKEKTTKEKFSNGLTKEEQETLDSVSFASELSELGKKIMGG